MSAAAAVSVERELAAIVGEGHVGPQEFTPSQLEINGVTPAAVVSPASAAEVAAVVRLAAERKLVIAPAGGFTKQDIGGVPERVDILVRTHRLNTIEQYDPGDLTISSVIPSTSTGGLIKTGSGKLALNKSSNSCGDLRGSKPNAQCLGSLMTKPRTVGSTPSM